MSIVLDYFQKISNIPLFSQNCILTLIGLKPQKKSLTTANLPLNNTKPCLNVINYPNYT